MDEFEQHRPRLRGVALRVLGTPAEADDAVQETWLRLQGADRAAVADLGAWLTTVVSRVALDQLRARGRRREEPLDGAPEPVSADGPEERVLLADAVLRADAAATRMGAPDRLDGAVQVAALFSGRALGARPAVLGDGVGILWAVDGVPRVAWTLQLDGDRVVRMEMVADAGRLAALAPVELELCETQDHEMEERP